MLQDGEIKVFTRENNDLEQGTTVALNVQEFNRADADWIVKDYMRYNRNAEVRLGGESVGVADSMKAVEVEFNEGGKNALLYRNREEGNTEPCEVTVCVHGVKIEGILVEGENLPAEVVLDLSRVIGLAENRGEIAVDSKAVEAVKQLTEVVTAQENPIPLFNALYPLVAKLQKRERTRLKENNMVELLQSSAREFFPDSKTLVPNAPEFQMLAIEDAVYVHPGLHRVNYLELPGVERCSGFQSETHTVYLVDLV